MPSAQFRFRGYVFLAVLLLTLGADEVRTQIRTQLDLISDGKIAGPNIHGFQETVNALLKEQIQVYGVAARYATFGSFGALTSYAAATGGDVYPGTSTDSIEKSFLRITEQARNQYVLGYVSANHAEHPIFRQIEVTTRSRNYTVIHRRGYTPQP